MSLGAQPGVVPLCTTWMRPSFKEDDAIGLEADLTETGKYGTIINVGRSKLLFEVQMMNSPSFLLPRAFSLYSRGPIGASW